MSWLPFHYVAPCNCVNLPKAWLFIRIESDGRCRGQYVSTELKELAYLGHMRPCMSRTAPRWLKIPTTCLCWVAVDGTAHAAAWRQSYWKVGDFWRSRCTYTNLRAVRRSGILRCIIIERESPASVTRWALGYRSPDQFEQEYFTNLTNSVCR